MDYTGSLTCVLNHSCACVYTRGLGTPTAIQHYIFYSEKTDNCLCVLLTGFEPPVFGSWVRRSTHWATPSPGVMAAQVMIVSTHSIAEHSNNDKKTCLRRLRSCLLSNTSEASHIGAWWKLVVFLNWQCACLGRFSLDLVSSHLLKSLKIVELHHSAEYFSIFFCCCNLVCALTK